MKKFFHGLTAFAVIIGLHGCASDQMTKENIGTGVGALAGALIGNKIGGNAVGTLIGAAAGGLVGKMIGARLDEEDRKALARHTTENLDTLKAGQSVAWRSDRSGSTANVQVSQVSREQRQVTISSASEINVPANVTLMNQTNQAIKPTPILSKTDSNSGVVGMLARGKTTRVIGKTDDDQWLLVSRKGTLIGFVKASDTKKYVPPVASKKTPAPAVADLDAMPAKEVTQSVKNAAFDLDAVTPSNTTTSATTECKTIVYDINAQGQRSQESTKACKTGAGTWELG